MLTADGVTIAVGMKVHFLLWGHPCVAVVTEAAEEIGTLLARDFTGELRGCVPEEVTAAPPRYFVSTIMALRPFKSKREAFAAARGVPEAFVHAACECGCGHPAAKAIAKFLDGKKVRLWRSKTRS